MFITFNIHRNFTYITANKHLQVCVSSPYRLSFRIFVGAYSKYLINDYFKAILFGSARQSRYDYYRRVLL